MNIEDLTNIWDQEAVEEVLNNPLADFIEYEADLNNIEWFNTKTKQTIDISDTEWDERYGIQFDKTGIIKGWFYKKELLEVAEEHKISPFQALLAYIEGYYMQVWQRQNQTNAIYGECESIYIHVFTWQTVH
jgi:predicted P-loop ATPase